MKKMCFFFHGDERQGGRSLGTGQVGASRSMLLSKGSGGETLPPPKKPFQPNFPHFLSFWHILECRD